MVDIMDKNFCYYLYTQKNVPDVLDKWCAPMLSDASALTRLKAKRLLKYWGLLTDKAFFDKRIQFVFNGLYDELNKNFPDLIYEFSGRIKGLLSTVNKLDEIEDYTISKLKNEFINNKFKATNGTILDQEAFFEECNKQLSDSGNNELKNEFQSFLMNYRFESNPFDRVRDFFAFRLVIEDSGEEFYINTLYKVANFIIDFFKKSTFEVIESSPLIQTGPLSVNSELLFVPKETGLNKEYIPLCKDYVLHPKKDGYQSIHFVVYDPYSDRYFEVQLRTRSMDIIAETLANHEYYKNERYSKQKDETAEMLDLSQIHMKGFRYFKYTDPHTGEEKVYISDRAGITQAIPIRLEFEHFLTMF